VRRTKIVATVGPASKDPAVLRRMVAAGMNMARLSLAHGPVEDTLEAIPAVRKAADDEGATVGILADLPGPKIRTAAFAEEVHVTEDERLELVSAQDGAASSDGRRIAVDHPELVEHLQAGDRVALGDGGVNMVVEGVDHDRATVRVTTGGHLMGRPGVMLPTARFPMESPTPEDLELL
jgi:pyruvate kinase